MFLSKEVLRKAISGCLNNCLPVLFFLNVFSVSSAAQSGPTGQPGEEGDSLAAVMTLPECLRHALKNQASVRQSIIDVSVAKTNKSIVLGGWLPQVNLAANYQRFLELPVAFLRVNDVLTPIRTGVANVSTPQLTATQLLFSADQLLANKAARIYIDLARENEETAKLEIVAAVTKAYYDVLLSMARIKVFAEDTQRQRRSMSDAFHRFQSGISDKVDFKQATIGLNNALTQLKSAQEDVQARYAVLKFYTGLPADRVFTLRADTATIISEMLADTSLALRPERRPEFRSLLLLKRAQRETTSYYNFAFLPTISAFYTYNLAYQNINFSDLYNRSYPNSFAGLQVNLPLFTGFRRIQYTHRSRLLDERLDWDIVNLKLSIYAEYKQALSAYKSNYYAYSAQAENLRTAREVYNIVKLQYDEGIKPYVDVIIAQTDLQTSNINYQNALYELLKSRTDLSRALGTLNTQP